MDNAYNRRLGRAGLPLSAVHSRSSNTVVQSTVLAKGKTYVDNAYNRRLGRVGLPLGSAVASQSRTNKNRENLRKLVTDIDEQVRILQLRRGIIELFDFKINFRNRLTARRVYGSI